MKPFALFRLPHADNYTRIEGETCELTACTQLNGQSGFVVAPFEVKPGQPIVVIRPEKVERVAVPYADEQQVPVTMAETTPSPDYHIDFANCHAQLESGTFRKIVLARCEEETLADGSNADPTALFHRACRLYPRLFVALVSTPQSGIWLTATPEILLEGQARNWRTIALAGTMRLEAGQLAGEGEGVNWSMKNYEEQRVVATYIAECLEQFTMDFHEEGPRTVRAANLVHLRSDFTFTLPDDGHIGNLLQVLHPTPAVCGLPKREAFRFIVSNEHSPRRYYSGFMGPLNLPTSGTHLYVSLRCMNIVGNRFYLYAGGGLLTSSTEQQEWQETEAKLQTMQQVLNCICQIVKHTDV